MSNILARLTLADLQKLRTLHLDRIAFKIQPYRCLYNQWTHNKTQHSLLMLSMKEKLITAQN